MWTTGTLSSDIMACACDTEPGVDHVAYIINLQDVDKAATVVSNLAISAIQYNPGAAALMCTLLPTSDIDVQAKMIRGNYRDGWDHSVTVRVMDNSTAIRQRIAELQHSRVMIVYGLRSSAGVRYFEVAGYELGLEVLDIDRNYNDEDTSGGWVIKFGCSDKFKEKDPPYIVGTAPGTIVVDATELETEELEISEAGVVGGILNTETGVVVAVPVMTIVVDSAGVASEYQVQKIDDYHQRTNIGAQLKPGKYTVKIMYTG